MTLTSGDWLLLIVQLVVGLGVLYAAFFKSYFREKGKNVATREDIEEITEKVEGVRAELQFSLQSRLSLREEEQASLVSCFSSYYAWYGSIIGLNFAATGANYREHLAEIRSNIERLQNDFDAASGRMELFATNQDIVAANGQLKIKTLELAAHAFEASFEFEQLCLELALVEKTTPLNDGVKASQRILSRQTERYGEFKRSQTELAGKLVPEIERQKARISLHIRNLAKADVAT